MEMEEKTFNHKEAKKKKRVRFLENNYKKEHKRT